MIEGKTFTIWVDADACPVPVREHVIKTCHRLSLPGIFVANKPVSLPQSHLISFVLVGSGADVADLYILERVEGSDIVVTQDILLAGNLIAVNIVTLNPRGDLYTEDNIGERVSTRNLMTHLRDTGQHESGAAPYSLKDKQRFANALDRVVTRAMMKLQK